MGGITTWDFRTSSADAGEIGKATELYFKRFRDYPKYPPLAVWDKNGVTLKFALPGDPPPTAAPEKPPITGTQLAMSL